MGVVGGVIKERRRYGGVVGGRVDGGGRIRGVVWTEEGGGKEKEEEEEEREKETGCRRGSRIGRKQKGDAENGPTTMLIKFDGSTYGRMWEYVYHIWAGWQRRGGDRERGREGERRRNRREKIHQEGGVGRGLT